MQEVKPPPVDYEKALERVGQQLREMAVNAWIQESQVGDARLPLVDINRAKKYYKDHEDSMILFNPPKND